MVVKSEAYLHSARKEFVKGETFLKASKFWHSEAGQLEVTNAFSISLYPHRAPAEFVKMQEEVDNMLHQSYELSLCAVAATKKGEKLLAKSNKEKKKEDRRANKSRRARIFARSN